jgi:hypothetical protein
MVGPVTIIGTLKPSEQKGSFTFANEKNAWFWIDLPEMQKVMRAVRKEWIVLQTLSVRSQLIFTLYKEQY